MLLMSLHLLQKYRFRTPYARTAQQVSSGVMPTPVRLNGHPSIPAGSLYICHFCRHIDLLVLLLVVVLSTDYIAPPYRMR